MGQVRAESPGPHGGGERGVPRWGARSGQHQQQEKEGAAVAGGDERGQRSGAYVPVVVSDLQEGAAQREALAGATGNGDNVVDGVGGRGRRNFGVFRECVVFVATDHVLPCRIRGRTRTTSVDSFPLPPPMRPHG